MKINLDIEKESSKLIFCFWNVNISYYWNIWIPVIHSILKLRSACHHCESKFVNKLSQNIQKDLFLTLINKLSFTTNWKNSKVVIFKYQQPPLNDQNTAENPKNPNQSWPVWHNFSDLSLINLSINQSIIQCDILPFGTHWLLTQL